MEMPSISSMPRMVEDIFKSFSARRSAIVRALTSDVDEFYSFYDLGCKLIRNDKTQMMLDQLCDLKRKEQILQEANRALKRKTKNYSGAELEGIVKSAVSFALNCQVSMDDLTKPLDEESIKVTMDDFLHAL